MLQAAGLQLLAAAILNQVVAALAGRTAEIVIALALLDDALQVPKGGGLVALEGWSDCSTLHPRR